MKMRQKRVASRKMKDGPEFHLSGKLKCGGKQLFREHLAILGMASRLQGAIVDDGLRRKLLLLTSRVIDMMRFATPRSPNKYLFITEMRGSPDAYGWISSSHKVSVPFWIPKRELSRLSSIEETLDALDCQRQAKD
jgi:hypothetical protein